MIETIVIGVLSLGLAFGLGWSGLWLFHRFEAQKRIRELDKLDEETLVSLAKLHLLKEIQKIQTERIRIIKNYLQR
jgi:hypothetical protein